MTVGIQLLGVPVIRVDGKERRVEGRKTWVLLAHLLLEPRPLTRRQLAGWLWAEADDPLRAERWAIHNLRRALAPAGVESRGSSLVIEPPEAVAVDARAVLCGNLGPSDASALRSSELLEGVEVDVGLAAADWLGLQRARLRSAVAEAWRTGAARLAETDPTTALALAARLLELDGYDDGAHELVIALHLARNDRSSAANHLRRAERLYRDELGEPLPASIRRPLDRGSGQPVNPLVAHDVAARALIEIARTRSSAGDYGGAVDAATRAVDDAAASGAPGLEAEALLTLAAPLIHGLRGRDREAAGILSRGLGLAERAGNLALQVEIEREQGYCRFLDGDYGAAEFALNRSMELARRAGDPLAVAHARVLLAGCRSDQGDEETAIALLDEAIATLARLDDRGSEAYARTYRARTYLHLDRLDDASAEARTAMGLAREHGRMSLLPWPMAIAAEAELRSGDIAAARARFGEAFTLACDIADPCWEALACRGLALVSLAEGQAEVAREALEDALARARRLDDTYTWAEALILTDLVELESGADGTHVTEAMLLVTRGSMRDLAARIQRSAGQTIRQTPRQ